MGRGLRDGLEGGQGVVWRSKNRNISKVVKVLEIGRKHVLVMFEGNLVVGWSPVGWLGVLLGCCVGAQGCGQGGVGRSKNQKVSKSFESCKSVGNRSKTCFGDV